MAGRQHEPVAVGPDGIGGIKFEIPREQHGGDIGHAHWHARMTGPGFFDGVDRQKADRVGHIRVRNIGTDGNTSESWSVHTVRLLRSMSWRISGVRMSCIARSSFDPWITIELARDMKLFGIIDSRYGKSITRGFFSRITTIDWSCVGIQRAMNGFEVSTVGTRWKLMSVSANCGQI